MSDRLGDINRMTEPISACYEEVLTHVGCVSLFIEPCLEPVELVFSESHGMELEGEVFTTVGGLSLLLQEGLGSSDEISQAVSKYQESTFSSGMVYVPVEGTVFELWPSWQCDEIGRAHV